MRTPKILLKKTYLSLIENSKGTRIFRDCFGIDKKIENLTEGGILSCAFYSTAICYLCGLISRVHLSISGALKDMKKNAWYKSKKLRKGSILLWEEKDGHFHLGFYLGNKKAISNRFDKKEVRIHHYTFSGKRKIEAIFWHKKLNSSGTSTKTIKES